jgi:rhomboid family GlyGly-CTERM serine protease
LSGEGRHGTRLWAALAALLAGLAIALWFAPREALEWRPSLWLGQPWRLWSAAFVHWTPWHLGANLIGCVVVAAFGAAARVPPCGVVAWLVAWPLGHAALALQPGLVSYGGLSGVLHGGVAVAAVHLLAAERGRRRAIGAAVLLGLAIKLVLERPWGAPTVVLPGWDFAVAPGAHVSGALAGLLCAGAARMGASMRGGVR